ncbi:DNA primase [Anoxybacterium hadale]|uniref:DNA primase n=1 Tax=Anoxybacterium hadale TaxID=3408580 RepID=A0ACD1A827_9FIRM|nr:DNA primase [Clostridiales bacterium]
MTSYSDLKAGIKVGAGFNDNIVDEIKSRCNIVDVIGRHVVLKKAGLNYKGVCPFHNEKTPSFVVSEAKQIFTCFGCGATGDVIEFVQKYNNLDFHGSVEKLADEYGIEIKSAGFHAEKERAALYEINREAAAYFYRAFAKGSNPGLEYMAKRGLDAATLRKFGIGYADAEWDSLYQYFLSKGADPKTLLELGLISNSKDRYYDKYRNRVIFPIINTRGKIIGFGGRILGDGTPKYLNSPESTIFLKKNNLYGLNLTRQDINKENYVILVEGYMDVISLYQHGIRNVSASLGTALTENQAAMLKRYTDNVILSYDADAAGQAAALRGLDILHKSGCKVKVLHVTDGKDPDDFIKKNGKDEFLKLVHDAMSFADYKIHILKQRLDMNTTEGSVEFLQETAKILRELSPVEADIYIKKIARETKISEGAIRLEINGNNNSDHGRNPNIITVREPMRNQQTAVRTAGTGTMIERYLIKLMLQKSSFVRKIKPYEEIFRSPSAYKIYELILSVYKDDEEIDIKKLEDSLEEEDSRLLHDIIENIQFADKEDQVFQDCVYRIHTSHLKKREKEIIQIMSILDDEKDRDKIETLTIELIEIQKEKNNRR